jgi:hypothetical protein
MTCSPSKYVFLTKDSIGRHTMQRKYRFMKRIARLMAFGAIAIGAGLAACSSAHQGVTTSSKATAPQQVQIPNAVKVPSGNKLAGSFEGHGVQIYQCTNNSRTLLQPAAIISDNGNPVALHSKGPVWISTIDGSEVRATPVSSAIVNHGDAIPELLLKATENHGAGQFGSVTYVQRLATKGGLAPKGPCADGIRVSVQYSAFYLFYTAG